jgi:tetratricopeptide (TPR) repeat protein
MSNSVCISQNNNSLIESEITDCFNNGKFDEAYKFFEGILQDNTESDMVLLGMQTAARWSEYKRELEKITDYLDKGNYLLQKWDVYCSYFRKIHNFKIMYYALKSWVFKQALEYFKQFSQIYSGDDFEILVLNARCYKALENYNSALNFFEKAYSKDASNADIIAQMADCYALNNKTRLAKVFFREAFFINAGTINLTKLESEFMKRLIKKTAEEKNDDEIAEWIPVYGKIFGIFNIKRELKPVELGKLKQATYNLENADLQSNRHLKPRLLNHYFWLIDHYLSDRNNDFSKTKVQDIMLKMQDLDIHIYNEFVK